MLYEESQGESHGKTLRHAHQHFYRKLLIEFKITLPPGGRLGILQFHTGAADAPRAIYRTQIIVLYLQVSICIMYSVSWWKSILCSS